MAVIGTLHILKNGSTINCECYDNVSDATPVDGGDCWQVSINGKTAYVGLQVAGKTGFDTSLHLSNSKGSSWLVQSKVVKTRKVVINQTAHQTIKVTYNGQVYTSSFTANIGASFSVSVVPETGYNAGTPNVSSGKIPYGTTDYVISASAAVIKRFTITVAQPANGNITVNGQVGTSFTFNYGTQVTIQANANSGYKVTALNVTGIGGVTNPYTFTLTGNISFTASIQANLTSNVRWKSRMFIGTWVARPKTYALPEILVSGTLKVELNGGAWNFANNKGDYVTEWSVISGTDNIPVSRTVALSAPLQYTADDGPQPRFSGIYNGNASVTIQRYDESSNTWINEWTGYVTVYYGDNDNAINNGTWSKNYGGVTTRIRPVITAIQQTGCRQDCINVYLTRIE